MPRGQMCSFASLPSGRKFLNLIFLKKVTKQCQDGNRGVRKGQELPKVQLGEAKTAAQSQVQPGLRFPQALTPVPAPSPECPASCKYFIDFPPLSRWCNSEELFLNAAFQKQHRQ